MATKATSKGKSSNTRVSSNWSNASAKASKSSIFSTKYIPKTSKWSPLWDAIIRIPPKCEVSEEAAEAKIDKYIDSVLYGKGKSRLPVFEDICREREKNSSFVIM